MCSPCLCDDTSPVVLCGWSKAGLPRVLAGPWFSKPLLNRVSAQDQRVTCPLTAQSQEEGEHSGNSTASFHFLQLPLKKRNKQKKRKVRKSWKNRWEGPWGTRMPVQLRSLCLSMVFVCCSSKQQEDAEAGRWLSLERSLKITTAGSLRHSPECSGTRSRA